MDRPNPEIVRLRNGAEVSAALVISTKMLIEDLFQTQPIAFIELVSLCRNNDHQIFGNAAEHFASLMDDRGQVFQSIADIVLSAVEGEGLNMRLVDPIGI